MTDPLDGAQVFEGVRVLDLGSGIAAPYAAMFLADQGADVVKVESAVGDPYRSDPGFHTINRNKRSVVSPDAVERLAPKADVIIVDQPGRAGELRLLAPTAVILAMPPWGENGPMVNDQATPALVHAATGIAWNQQSYAEVPVDVIVPIAAYGTGVLGALGAATGLVHRRITGIAPTYEVSQVAGAAAIQLGEFRVEGDTEPRAGDSGLGSKGRVGCYRLIEAGDGKWFFLACGTTRFYQRMLDVIGRPELIDDPLLANPPWGLMADDAIARITPILDEVFATRTRDEWLALLAAADVPAQPVLTRDEFLRTSIVGANEMDVSVLHPEAGEVEMMGIPVTVQGAAGSIRRPAPLLGQHTNEVLSEWAAVNRSDRGFAAGSGERPLAGLRVLDLAGFIAGPVVSRHLAMLGAEVLKIEAPTGDPFRGIGGLFASWNQGKKSRIIDLTTASGRAALHTLVAEADVVIENFRPGVSTRLGCDQATLSTLNPRLIFLSSPGFGLDDSMADRPAFDPLVQALGGFMAAQGGWPDSGPEPVFLSVAIHDLMTPLLGAFGVVCGLWRRLQSNRSQHVRTSLVQSTMVSQAAEYTRFEGRKPVASGGFDHPGSATSYWTETTEGYQWVDGDQTVPVCVSGLTDTDLARANGLVVTQDSASYGRLTVFGQLIGGAGPAPGPVPHLGDHGERGWA